MCIVVKFLSIKLNFNVDHFNWPVSIVYCFLVRVRVFVRVCVDACVFSFLRVFVFSFINSQPSFKSLIKKSLFILILLGANISYYIWHGDYVLYLDCVQPAIGGRGRHVTQHMIKTKNNYC